MKKKNYADVPLFSWRTFAQTCSRSLFTWKPLFLLVSLLMGLTAVAQSNGDIKIIDGNEYKITDAAKREVGLIGSSNAGEVTIPSTVQWSKDAVFTVTSMSSIKWRNFTGNITVLRIPETCTTIREGAITESRTLHTIHIPAGTKTIHKGFVKSAFALRQIKVAEGNPNYKDVDGVLFDKNSTILLRYPTAKDVGNKGVYRVPNTIKTIYTAAFEYNKSLKELHLPASLTTVEMRTPSPVFGADNLAKIVLDPANKSFKVENNILYSFDKTRLYIYPDGLTAKEFTIPASCTTLSSNSITNKHLVKLNLNKVTTLDWAAIGFCDKLTTIVLSDAMTSLRGDATRVCPLLANIEVSTSHPHLHSHEGVLYNKTKTEILKFPEGKGGVYTILPTTTLIGRAAFYRCTKLTGVNIPEGVTHIKTEAFIECNNLATVNFMGADPKLQVIEPFAFKQTKISTIRIPKKVQAIKLSAFSTIPSLTSVTVAPGAALHTIEERAFVSCPNLTSFTFEGGNNTLQTIGERAFYQAPLKNFTFPSSLTTIGSGAFSECKQLTTVHFPTNSSIQTIGTGAFSGCTGLTNVDLPPSVVTIASEAFVGCSAIRTVTLGRKTKTVHHEAFKNCPNLVRFEVAHDNPNFSSVKGMLCSKNKSKLIVFPPALAQSATLLPPSLTEIGDYAFYNNQALTNVTIPKKVTKIGKRAFGLCNNLTSVTFLCDVKIDPATIPQDQNFTAFDNGTNNTEGINHYNTVSLYVRENLYNSYKSDPFYQKFKKGIESSFRADYLLPNGEKAGTCEYMPFSDTEASLLSTNVTGVTTFVADKVTHPITKKVRSVGLIGDYAFENSTVQEVVLKAKKLSYIGAMAFITKLTRKGADVTPVGSSITDVFICSDLVPTQLGAKDFELPVSFAEFNNTQNIYVKNKMLESFKNEATWADYKNRGQIKDQIPGPTIANSYISFSREFDVDLEIGSTNRDIHAFVGGKAGVVAGDGDAGATTLKKVSFTSINVAGQGTYIPANTGVIIKNISKNATKTFKYRIGEKDTKTYTVPNNMLKPVTEKAKTLTASAANYYVLQQGIFRFINKTKTPTATIPVHKAYLELKAGSAAGDLYLHFEGDDDLTTGVEAVEVETTTRAPYYRLDGTRVVAPGRGLYIHNGKKVFLNK